MGCAGCNPDAREQAELWEVALKKAKQYAVEKNVMVVVYKNEVGEALYMEAKEAQALGIQGQFVSPVRPNANGGIH